MYGKYKQIKREYAMVEQQRRQLERMEEEEAEAKRMAMEAKVAEQAVEEEESRHLEEVCSLPADGGSCTAASFQR